MTAYTLHYTLVPLLTERVLAKYPTRVASYSAPDAAQLTTVTFTPDFAGADLTTVDDIAAVYATLRDDVVGLRQYHGLSSPTNAQTVAAVKGIIRVLRYLLRDQLD